MKFLADECCDTGLVESLRNDGHDVSYVAENQVPYIIHASIQNPVSSIH
ncbi:DUF5615 family PIN-like protein [Thermodesulfobacteriota bacterium]